MTPPSDSPAGQAIEAARLARLIRGTGHEQCNDVLLEAADLMEALHAQNERMRELLERISHIGGFRMFNDILPEVRRLLGKDQP
jgi:hypothetical protein